MREFVVGEGLKIISGGQTGVDRAALDIALELGMPCGGWCPKGRRAEDGPIPEKYPLSETPSVEYPTRTRMNVRDSDATLVLTKGKPDRGTALTCSLATGMGKPLKVIDLNNAPKLTEIRGWIKSNDIKVLNVAGPRESSKTGIYEQAGDCLRRLLKPLAPLCEPQGRRRLTGG